jgi:hypothetical protein
MLGEGKKMGTANGTLQVSTRCGTLLLSLQFVRAMDGDEERARARARERERERRGGLAF